MAKRTRRGGIRTVHQTVHRPHGTSKGKVKARRVVIQRPNGVDERGRRLRAEVGNRDTWERRYYASVTAKIYPVVRLTEAGVDWGTMPAAGEEVGYGMHPYRTDDCLQAAIATATQVPIEQVPDLRLDEQLEQGRDPDEINREGWERIDRWATKRGFRAMWHEHHEVPAPRTRWIGVVCPGGPVSRFEDHCVVMSYDRLIFDPSCSVHMKPGFQAMQFDPREIDYGISFDRIETIDSKEE